MHELAFSLKTEPELLGSSGMLLPPEGCRRQPGQSPPTPGVVNAGMAAGAKSNQQMFPGETGTTVMNVEALPCPGPAADLAHRAVAFDDPGAQTGKGGAIAPVSRITTTTESVKERPGGRPAGATPESGLLGATPIYR